MKNNQFNSTCVFDKLGIKTNKVFLIPVTNKNRIRKDKVL